MNIKCGIDIIEIDRIKEAITNNKIDFINKVYTEREINYCESKKNSKYQHYAARFAAKEAVFKSINGLLKNKYDIDWKDIEIVNKINGEPEVILKKEIKNIESIAISISHCKNYAVANVFVCIQ